MFQITFRNVPIENHSILNRPSYMRQNSYGNLTYIPIIEPLKDVSLEECRTKEVIEACSNFSSPEEVIGEFLKRYPESNEGHLNDAITVSFLGFQYMYHPKHKTYYGTIPNKYILMPVLARWYAAVSKDFDEGYLSRSITGFPPEYNGGNGMGIDFGYNEDSVKEEAPVASPKTKFSGKRFGDSLIPITAPGSACRAISCMAYDTKLISDLDKLIEFVGQGKGSMIITNTSPACKYPCVAEGIKNGVKKLFVAVPTGSVDVPSNVTPAGIIHDTVELYVINGVSSKAEFEQNYPADWRK